VESPAFCCPADLIGGGLHWDCGRPGLGLRRLCVCRALALVCAGFGASGRIAAFTKSQRLGCNVCHLMGPSLGARKAELRCPQGCGSPQCLVVRSVVEVFCAACEKPREVAVVALWVGLGRRASEARLRVVIGPRPSRRSSILLCWYS